ncbi:MAG: DMT family transporter [Candidatus Bipolaricaulota bacterium]|nr:DMT family transporter [Candidatus Bipolaricaulota bacterium]MBS3791842.1 DMT family transporter [Candidatus Bipolaricaulota bacterium]
MSIILAFISAILFGLATPISKTLLGGITPFQLAGLLYLGASLGLLPKVVSNKGHEKVLGMRSSNKLRLVGAILLGGIGGPLALLFGLRLAAASSVSMWLNLEMVFTVLLGHFLFEDYLGYLGWLGAAGAISAAVLLSWGGGVAGVTAGLLVALACLFWGFDNHFTALIDEISPASNTFFKGLVAGTFNLTVGLILTGYGAGWARTLGALGLGFFSYGLSIAFYIGAAHGLGATRAQIVFASAPFFGVAGSILILGERLSPVQIIAALILVASLVPLLIDKHLHAHSHGSIEHEHLHRHSEGHHEHSHENAILLNFLFHSHGHQHEEVSHSHPHLPDIHHRHEHGDED